MSENEQIAAGNEAGPDPVDEFAGLSPAPPARSPILALVVIGVSLATLFHLRSDIRYAFESHTPTPLAVLTGSSPSIDADLAHGRYVTVEGLPDRRNSLYIEARGDKSRETFFRLVDTATPVFVRAKDTATRADLSNRWSGRLRRFGDVSFAASLREYFTQGVEMRRYLEPGSLRAAVEHHAATVVDRLGRSVSLTPTTTIEIEQVPDHYVLELLREKFPTQEDAQHELLRIVQPLGAPIAVLPTTDPEVYQFSTPLLENDLPRRNKLLDALAAGEIVFSLGHRASTTTFSALTPTSVPWDQVATVAVREPLQVADQALVLTEGEAPQAFVWAPIVAALLLALALWNVWYLVRPRRATA